jgi:hypothetical protein
MEFAKKASEVERKQTRYKKCCLELLRTAMTFLLRFLCWLMEGWSKLNPQNSNKIRAFSAGGVARFCVEGLCDETSEQAELRRGIADKLCELTAN